MCGNPFKSVSNIVSNAFKNPLSTIGDVAAIATGNPLFAVAGNTANGVTKGDSFGKSIGSGLKAGAETFAGNEISGAVGNAFPETFGSINDALGTGFSTSGNSLTDALGQTSGAGTSFDSISNALGKVPGDISSLIGGLGDSASSSFDSIFSPSGGGDAAGVSSPTLSAAAPVGDGFGITGGSEYDPSKLMQGVDQSANAFNSTVGSLDPGAAGGISAAPAVAAPAATPSSIDSFLSNPSLSTALGVGKANAGAVIPAAALAFEGIKGEQLPKGYNELKTNADQLAGQGTQLQSYLQSGQLPPGAQSAIDQATQSQKAAIRSQYASRGMSGSSAEQQDLARVDQQAQAQGFSIATQLLSQGVQENQLASGIYQSLMNSELQQDKELGSAFANFGSAVNGGNPMQTIKLTV
jgi:hypothetical protein